MTSLSPLQFELNLPLLPDSQMLGVAPNVGSRARSSSILSEGVASNDSGLLPQNPGDIGPSRRGRGSAGRHGGRERDDLRRRVSDQVTALLEAPHLTVRTAESYYERTKAP